MKEKEFLPLVEKNLGISQLNDMQRKMLDIVSEKRDIILLSPTGSGKTLAFILPILKILKTPTGRTQVVVIAPSRELVTQIAGVFKSVASDYRIVSLYGGHKVEDEVNSLKVVPDIIISTPGRLLDHINRHNIDVWPVRIVVLDEFDKSLELGFEDEMKKVLARMKNVSRYILTSATRAEALPEFLKLNNPIEVNFIQNSTQPRQRMTVKKVVSPLADKLDTLKVLLHNISDGKHPDRTIIFINHRESAERVYNFLKKERVDCVLYHGALQQQDRESAIARFNNGTTPILVATDLASRGLDIEGVKKIIHYHQPLTAESWTHRNGRTARVDANGDIYVIIGPEEDIKEYVDPDMEYNLDIEKRSNLQSDKTTLYISSGKREKLSKGDILGFLTKVCGLNSEEVGKIDIFDHYSLVAVAKDRVKGVLSQSKISKIKGEKRKIEEKR